MHDAVESTKRSRHIDTVVSHHCLIQLIVSYNLAQQQTSWEELAFYIDEGLALPTPKRKRTTNTTSKPPKRRHYSKIRIGREMFHSLQGSSSQPLELLSSENEKCSQTEGRGNQESELEEETEHSSEEDMEGTQLSLNPSASSPQNPL